MFGSALLGVAGVGFDLGDFLVELGQRAVFGFVDQLLGFGRVGGCSVGYGVGLLGGEVPGEGGGGHVGLVGQAAAGLEGSFGGGGAHAGLVGELFGGGAVAVGLPG